MGDLDSLIRSDLERDEGRRTMPYLDTEGVLTIGVGWNLQDNGLPERIIDQLLALSINTAQQDAYHLFHGYSELTDSRKRVAVNMAFNLGRARLATFRRMISAVNIEDWGLAADEMLDSKWARQVGDRAVRLADLMRIG